MGTSVSAPDTPPVTTMPASAPLTSWESPEEGQGFWLRDRMHFPDAMTPLEASVFTEMFQRGLAAAQRAYEMPASVRSRTFGGYIYMSQTPPPLSPEEAKRVEERVQQRMQEAVGRLGEIWQGEVLPEIQRYLAEWESFDLAGAPMPRLVEQLMMTYSRCERLWELHFRTVIPAYVAMSQFQDLYADLFGGQGLEAHRLLQGIPNKTVESGREMWALSRLALKDPEVRRVLLEVPSREAPSALERTPAGRAFVEKVRGYLREYGQRGISFEISQPSWIEDPTPVYERLREFAAQPERDLDAEMRELAEERERRVAEAREALRGYPKPVQEEFEALLCAAQEGVVLSEDHGFWIDFRSLHQVRRVAMELGRRLAQAEALSAADDVWYLTCDELLESAETQPHLDRRDLVARRREELAAAREAVPPPFLGPQPEGPPPDDPMARSWTRFFGAPVEPSEEKDVVRGHAGSPGKVRARARVLRSLAEADRLGAGEVLVAETTAPPWTPLFAVAGAVVTDTGGVLSHGAVVAREYRIPAVVGALGASQAIRDGQWVEVDGDAGTVRLLPED